MKLTKLHREAFVRAVMADVPAIDYAEKLQKLIAADVQSALPKPVLAVYNDPELRGALGASATVADACSGWMQAQEAGLRWISVPVFYKPTDKCKAAAKKIYADAVAQAAERKALEAKISGAIAGCTTRKAALERLPEFKKYLPAEAEPSTMLPAIANLAADLMKAGWKKPKAVAA